MLKFLLQFLPNADASTLTTLETYNTDFRTLLAPAAVYFPIDTAMQVITIAISVILAKFAAKRILWLIHLLRG